MSEAYFWGLSLDGEKASETWNPELESEEGKPVAYRGDHILNIKQAVLGGSAKPGELNVVEVEVMGFQGSLKLPVVRLQADTVPQTQLDLSFPDPPVKFTLIQGKGPIHLIGNLAISNPIDDAMDELDEEEEYDEEELDEKKMVGEDDEEEDFEDEMPKKKVKNAANMIKQDKGTPVKKKK